MTDFTHIGDLKPDTRNARKHNPRNIGMIADALQEVGAARSIVIDEDGNLLAGHGTIEAAAQAGITKMQVIDGDGETIIAVRRSGLSPRQKKRLAIYDNRTAELAEWEPEVLAEDKDILAGLFSDNELAILTGDFPMPDDPRAEWEGMPDFEQGDERPHSGINVLFRNQDDRVAFLQLLGEKPDRTKTIWYPTMPYLKQD